MSLVSPFGHIPANTFRVMIPFDVDAATQWGKNKQIPTIKVVITCFVDIAS
jgi:hypothetical protein